MPTTSDTVPVDGLRFDVRVGGPQGGRSVILLHGFPQTARSWRRVEPLLHTAGLRTFAPDQRGYSAGARPRAVGDYTVDRLARDVVGIADALGLDRFDLVGHDWGGFVGWQVAAQTPHRLRSLTVLSTPHPAAFAAAYDSDADQRRRSRYIHLFRWRALPKWFLLRRDAAALRSAFGDEVPPDVADAYVAALSQPGALRAALNWYRANAIRALRGTPAVSVPTTYLWGSSDMALRRTAAEATRNHVDGDYRFIEIDGGHWIPEARPDQAAAAITQRVTETA